MNTVNPTPNTPSYPVDQSSETTTTPTDGTTKPSFGGADMDPFTLIMMLQEERVGLLDGQVKSQSERMQGINTEIKDYGKTITMVNDKSSKLKEGDSKVTLTDQEVAELKSKGVKVEGNEVSKDQLNSFAETLKQKRDGLNNDSQMEMIRLQGLINKQQQAYQLMTNIQKKEHDTIMATINKIN
ncbi:hypothetical protein BTA51_14245 [Hahella sp. CCB-MM4]|uniref:hypothetical protein n=1 Tax=Hahella sp. (strain CCB-MM4) TaxID=1926491 RepID=UPI000B9AC6C1|nr:hypothetical protein [Hahella sp. CCB-MM4]OZG72686.1 hypothetical protein BTA51_14245 [Hahella sp. CCB-MM4]